METLMDIDNSYGTAAELESKVYFTKRMMDARMIMLQIEVGNLTAALVERGKAECRLNDFYDKYPGVDERDVMCAEQDVVSMDALNARDRVIQAELRRAAAELDYLLLEGWNDQFKLRLKLAVEAQVDPMEAEFQQLRDDVGAGE
jgi:hypothetical protein